MKAFLITSLTALLASQCALGGDSLTQVELEAHFVQFKSSDIQDLARTGTVDIRALQALRKKGKSELLYAPLKLTTVSGQEAVVKAVTEHIYPTDFDVARIRDVPITNETTKVARIGSFVNPSGFETREVGAILCAQPEVIDNNTKIRIQLAPQVVYELDPVVFAGKYVDSRGKETEVKLVQPIFRAFAISTTVILDDGATTFFGSLDNITEEKVLCMFLTARIVKTDGMPDKGE